jgi:cytochrome b involved in lipid metabolism
VENIFDLVFGLPVHPLIDHFVVVLVPMFALLQILIVFKPKLKEKFGWVTFYGLAVALGATVIASQSGEALVLRVGHPGDHAEQGEKLVAIIAALFVSSAIWIIFTEKLELPNKSLKNFIPWVGKASAVIAIAAIGATAIVGHSGAKAVWENKVAQTSDTTAVVPSESDKALTAEEVALHSTATDCWSVVNGNVYDLTSFVNRHPGGSGNINLMCGKDATSAFTGQHGSGGKANNELSNLLLGPLSGTSNASLAPAPAGIDEEGEQDEDDEEDDD